MVALASLIALPMLFGVLLWISEKIRAYSANWLGLVAIVVMLAVLVVIPTEPVTTGSWPWFARFNISFSLYFDGLAQVMIAMTLGLGALCVLVSWREVQQYRGFFFFNLFFSLAGINGVFLAQDLFLFFLFWEVMLLPMTALILIWGHEQRRYAAIKFFIFTQVSSLLMLIAILALAFIHQRQAGQISFDLISLGSLSLSPTVQYWLMLGFFIAFAVKLPSVPFHTWLPDAHTQAPTAGSVLLAGILLKTGAYGLIRIVLPLFPDAAVQFAPWATALGAISIVYGAIMAFSQQDFKRLVAYSSISHMGFVMLALFSFHPLAYNGALLTLVAHGISSAALFSIAGALQHRLHSRSLSHMGGMWQSAPTLAAMTLVFVMAGIGLPGFANFNGELYALLGAFQRFPVVTVVAALGVTGSALYGMHLFQSSFQGPAHAQVADLKLREQVYCWVLVVALIYFGLQPGVLLELMHSDSQILTRTVTTQGGV